VFCDELVKLAVTFADVDRFSLRYGDLFAIRCYIVVAEFGEKLMLFTGVIIIYTLVIFSRT